MWIHTKITNVCFLLINFSTKYLDSSVSLDISTHRHYRLLDHEDCGLCVTSRIIGGDDAEFGRYPWMALIALDDSSSGTVVVKCGGTVISQRYVLTAAHCVHLSVHSLTIVLGEYNLDEDPDCGRVRCAPPAQRARVEEALSHPGYNHSDENSPHDIALVRTDRDILFDDFLQPICLPLFGGDLTSAEKYDTAEVAGWGSNSRYGMLWKTRILQHLSVRLVSPSECSWSVREGQLCVATDRLEDTCNGDSGGPLMRVAFHPRHFVPRYFLIGILSYGKSICAYSTTPMTVYTNVTAYLNWILDSIKP